MRAQGEGLRSLVKAVGGNPGENNLVDGKHPFTEGNQERAKYKFVS